MAFDFPTTPTVGQIYNNYTWDGEKWLLRTGGSYAKKNYIINGAMMVSQENGTTAGTPHLYYPVDQFNINLSFGGTLSVAQVASTTPAGSPNRFRCTVTGADASVATGDIVYIRQAIEGLRAADLNWGSASAKTVIIQFGVKAPAGTYCVSLMNAANNRSYIAEYTIAAGEANTDVVKSVVVSGDTAGTWLKDTNIGIIVSWTLMAGATYQQTAGSWAATTMWGSASQFNFLGTGGNVFELFDVSLTDGSVAPPFMAPDYASELAACQRYYCKSFPSATNPANAGDSSTYVGTTTSATVILTQRIYYAVRMRSPPTMTYYPPSTGTPVSNNWQFLTSGAAFANAVTTNYIVNDAGFSAQLAIAGGTFGTAFFISGGWTANARL